MKKIASILILAGLMSVSLATPSYADWNHGYRGGWGGQGHWWHGVHGGRPGWWWVLGNSWAYYPRGPVYSYGYAPPPVVLTPPRPVPYGYTYYPYAYYP